MAETNPRARITEEKIEKFVETMRSNVLIGETPFRRAYIRSVIDQVEVDDDEIRIWAAKTVLERLVAARRQRSGRSAQFCSEVARRTDSALSRKRGGTPSSNTSRATAPAFVAIRFDSSVILSGISQFTTVGMAVTMTRGRRSKSTRWRY